ncbi:unnamed protein product, partial [marine sediment metagenome]
IEAQKKSEDILSEVSKKKEAQAEAEAVRIIAQAHQEAEEIKNKAEIEAQKKSEDILSKVSKKKEAQAEAEAVRIIAQAHQEAEEIKNKAEIEAQKKSEDILSKVSKKKEAQAEEGEQPVQFREEITEEKIEKITQLRKESTVSELAELIKEELPTQHLAKEMAHSEEPEPAQLRQKDQTVYNGEVELDIDAPVDLNMLSKLYDSLQTISQLRILRTSGSVKQGTTITIVLEKPMPLIDILSSNIPRIQVTQVPPGEESLRKRKWSSPLEGKK